jgi:hypothetical protein
MVGDPDMELKPQSAQVVGLTTSIDPEAVSTGLGPVVWATVRIDYMLAGLSPSVAIRVPIAVEAGQGEGECRAQALRNARALIDHACRASGIAPEEPGPMEALIEEMQGISQELGITRPTAQPKRPGPGKI